MSFPYVKGRPEGQSSETLKQYYDRLPAEKKPYLTALDRGVGPWLATEKGEYILDAASQIATLGLGFNHSALYGTGHFVESWLNRSDTLHFKRLREGYRRFFQHRLLWEECALFLCNSGAEAIETALGDAYRRRQTNKQKKVLAFEGSFHGRFLISLSSTWNPAKRQLFEWPDYQTCFVPFPEMKNDYRKQPKVDPDWTAIWQQASRSDFEETLPSIENPLLQAEIKSLLEVRRLLLSGEIFAIVIEPMQCEGGDRYTSFGFQHALLNMARVFKVPVVYDEVQTGFYLGGEMFWHRLFDLKDPKGQPLHPDYVVCAKKAQVGLVLSHAPIPFAENFCTASVIRGYAQALTLDQSRSQIRALEKLVRGELDRFVKRFSNVVENPRSQGLAFSVDFKDKDLLPKFVEARFNHGLLFYPAGANTARFRMNLAFQTEEVKFLFKQLGNCLLEALGEKVKPFTYQGRQSLADMWGAHSQFLYEEKLEGSPRTQKSIEKFFDELYGHTGIRLKFLTKATYPKYRRKIMILQKKAYEPARQTPIDRFDQVMKSRDPLGIVLEKGDTLAGITFLGTLSSFPYVRGTRNDPEFYTPKVLYSVDVTVHPKYQNMGIGKFLKTAAHEMALGMGIREIHGRNRDQVAAAMIKINVSLGFYELQHLTEDYPDDGAYRCAFYYANPVKWEWPKLSLSQGIKAPLDPSNFDRKFIQKNTPSLVNKVCLSNFVSRDFLDRVRRFLDQVPEPLRQAYTTSGQSECVEKIVKSIWTQRKTQKVLTFDRCYFGEGSFMSRSLSGIQEFFPVTRLPFPTRNSQKEVLNQLQEALSKESYHSIWVEPITQREFLRMPKSFLDRLKELAGDVPVVSNDTGSLFHRYCSKHFLASHCFAADAGFSFLGGQMGVCYLSKKYFVDQPLAMISTWDGDEFSMAQFSYAMDCFLERKDEILRMRESFGTMLTEVLGKYQTKFRLQSGFGVFSGSVPDELAQFFEDNGLGQSLVCPTEGAMEVFMKEYV